MDTSAGDRAAAGTENAGHELRGSAAMTSLRAAVAAAWLGILVGQGTAADIQQVSTVSLADDVARFQDTCTYSLTGDIVEGDGARLAEILRRPLDDNDFGPFGILCLDSTGGCYAEAIKMIDALKESPAGTYIRAGAKCLSACSLVFMAGRVDEHETGPLRFRFLHANGQLGFHSPALEFPEGTYDKEIVETAYREALKSVSQAIDRLLLSNDADGTAWMKPSIISLMLATPAAEMAYIDTVDEIGRWDISVVPNPPVDASKLNLRTGCNNLWAWRRDEAAEQPGRVISDTASVERVPVQANDDTQYRVVDEGMYNTGCVYTFRPYGEGQTHIKVVPFFEIDNLAPGALVPYQFLHPQTRLPDIEAELAKLAAGPVITSGSRCRITDNDSKLLDDESCTFTRSTSSRKDTVAIEEYQWPTGTRTVVSQMRNGDWLINGNKAYRQIDNTRDGTPICYFNLKSGNRFCYYP
jgi:hypothetical protein